MYLLSTIAHYYQTSFLLLGLIFSSCILAYNTCTIIKHCLRPVDDFLFCFYAKVIVETLGASLLALMNHWTAQFSQKKLIAFSIQHSRDSTTKNKLCFASKTTLRYDHLSLFYVQFHPDGNMTPTHVTYMKNPCPVFCSLQLIFFVTSNKLSQSSSLYTTTTSKNIQFILQSSHFILKVCRLGIPYYAQSSHLFAKLCRELSHINFLRCFLIIKKDHVLPSALRIKSRTIIIINISIPHAYTPVSCIIYRLMGFLFV